MGGVGIARAVGRWWCGYSGGPPETGVPMDK